MTMTIPNEWTFRDDDVADHFDSHVREQLPWYDLVTNAIAQIGRHYITEEGDVLDLGCSTGNIGRALAPTLYARSAQLLAVDESAEMIARYDGPGTPEVADIATACWPVNRYDLIVANLVLMFLPPDSALDVLDGLIAALTPGGAVITVDRFLPPAGYPGVITSRLTLAGKLAAGATPEQIIDKELSLSGVQRPLDRRAMQQRGGVEWFRFGDFSGWLFERTTAP